MPGSREVGGNATVKNATEEVVSISFYAPPGPLLLRHVVLQVVGGGTGGHLESIGGAALACCKAALSIQVCRLTRSLAVAVGHAAVIRAACGRKAVRVRYGFLKRTAVLGIRVTILAKMRPQVSNYGLSDAVGLSPSPLLIQRHSRVIGPCCI